MEIVIKDFGTSGSKRYVMTNDNGLVLEVSDFGARIVRLLVPSQSAEAKNIVLGFDSEEEYLKQDTYVGATIGRVAGRLAQGQFSAEGVNYQLAQNESGNTLHGGPTSFETKLWQTEISEAPNEIKIRFTYHSGAGENGFPGNLLATVTYSLTNQNEWHLDYTGVSDETTLYNPTNHVYFNLSGDFTQTVADHAVIIDADKFCVLDEQSLPTGELRSVTGTPFDFRNPVGSPLATGFSSDYQQNQLVNGYDHPFVLNSQRKGQVQVSVSDPTSKIKVEMATDAPAVVVYTTNMGASSWQMFGQTVTEHCGVTLESQILPDAINHPNFGEIKLAAHEEFTTRTTYTISY